MNWKGACDEFALVFVALVAFSCRHAKHSESTPELIHNLQSDARIQGRAAAARILGERKESQAVPPLITALKDSEPVRLSAARALANFRDPRVVSPLIDLLKDDYPLVREAAARALGDIKDSGAIEPLIAAMKAGNEAAGPALSRFGQTAVQPLIGCLTGAEGSHAAADALIRIGKPAAGPLIQAFNSNADSARISIARALAEIDDPRVTEILNSALRDGDVRLASATYRHLLRTAPPSSDYLLFEVLRTYGNGKMAEDFLHSRKPRLVAAAKNWAAQNLFSIESLEQAGVSHARRH